MPLSKIRFPLLSLAILTLVFATLAGLMRLGWKAPTIHAGWMAAHGPLMLSGFLGTLISLERAVALGQRWMYIGPALSGLGGLALLAGVPIALAQILIILGSVGLIAIFGVIVRRHFALFTVVMSIGALAWLGGNLVWLNTGRVPFAAPWWVGFLILTIAGERLELGRLSNIPLRALIGFVVTGGLFASGWVVSLVNFDWGIRLTGLGMLGLAGWLFRNDIARRTVRKPGLTRYIAICMLLGYVWLAVGGVLGMVNGGVVAGAQYDAWLHSIFLGFGFSMIFGHAPIIFPAILGRMIQYSGRFYLHLIVLHASLVLRVAGDLSDWFIVRRWGGLLNSVALLIFLVNTVWAVWGSRNKVNRGVS